MSLVIYFDFRLSNGLSGEVTCLLTGWDRRFYRRRLFKLLKDARKEPVENACFIQTIPDQKVLTKADCISQFHHEELGLLMPGMNSKKYDVIIKISRLCPSIGHPTLLLNKI